MRKTVLDVGNCAIDHAAIQRMIRENFGADVLRALGTDDAFQTLRTQPVDLVLVNRRLHADHGDGIELIRLIKSDPELAAIPVMLVSDYPRYQRVAVDAGAEFGFGKAELTSPETPRKLQRYLA